MLRMGFIMATAILAVTIASTSPLNARQWTDSSGKYHQEAELVEFDGHLVVLKKAKGQLVAVPLNSLSTADQQYLQSKDAKDAMTSTASQDRTWTLNDGKKFKGMLLRFGEKDVVISRNQGMLSVNGKPFTELSPFHQYMIPELVTHEEGKSIPDANAIANLIAYRKGADLTYRVKGALFQLSDGALGAVPIWMLSSKDFNVIEPEWDAWLAAEKDKQAEQQRQEMQSTMARAAFNEYQRNEDISQRLQYLQVASQWFDLWQVQLIAPNGAVSVVTVPARDSRTAQYLAQQKCPACGIGATQMLSKRNY